MSQLARFVDLPILAVQRGLLPASMPRRRLFRKPLFVFEEYLAEHGREQEGLDIDGTWWILLLTYLRKYEKIDLLSGPEGLGIMARALSKYQGGAFTLITHEESQDYLEKIRGVRFEPEKVKDLLVEEGLSTPDKVASDVYSDLSTWTHVQGKLIEKLSSISEGRVLLTSIA